MDHGSQPWGSAAIAVVTWLFPSLFSFILWRALLILWWRPRRIRRIFESQGIPCLPCHLYHGNLPELVAMNREARSGMASDLTISHDIAPSIIPHYYRWSKAYGEKFVYWMGSQARFTVTEPEQARQILSDFERFEKPYRRPDARDVIANGLATLNGADWHRHRRITNPAFLAKHLQAMIPKMVSCAIRMIEDWENASEIDVHKQFVDLTASIIAQTAFESTPALGKRVAKLQHEQNLNIQKALRSVYIPGIRFLPTPFNRHRWRVNHELNAIIRRVVERKIAAVGGDSDANSLIRLMIAAAMGELHGNRRSLRMRIDEVISECKTFFFTGHETTAAFLTWTCFLLAINLQWQERAREDVRTVCGMTDSPGADSASKLKVVHMVMNESLRLYPPAVSLFRTATRDTQVGEVLVPAGTELVLPIIAWHHDPNHWGHDAHEFRPERFGLRDSGRHDDLKQKKKKKKEVFLPFSMGPRNCIGQSFAMLEAKLVLSIVLQRFRFSLSPGYRHSPINILMLHPEFGMPLLLEKL